MISIIAYICTLFVIFIHYVNKSQIDIVNISLLSILTVLVWVFCEFRLNWVFSIIAALLVLVTVEVFLIARKETNWSEYVFPLAVAGIILVIHRLCLVETRSNVLTSPIVKGSDFPKWFRAQYP